MISVGTVWASTMFAISGIITTIVENIIFLFVRRININNFIKINLNIN